MTEEAELIRLGEIASRVRAMLQDRAYEIEKELGRIHEEPKDFEPRIAALVKKKFTRVASPEELLRTLHLPATEFNDHKVKKKRKFDLLPKDMLDIVHSVIVEKLSHADAA